MALDYFDNDRFAVLTQDCKEHLTRVGEVVEYQKGDLILDYGLCADFLPIILKGNVRVVRNTEGESNKELLLYFLEPGEACPCASFSQLPDASMPITVEAESTCKILHVPMVELSRISETFSEWRLFELASFRSRFEELLMLVDNAIFNQLEYRLLAYIEKHRRFNNNRGMTISTVKIASDLGTSREVISRLLKNLENKGVIKRDKAGVHLQQ
ncbi:MAG: hypothetical protein CMP53_03395 [Flavobacteriales bacterium]|nr:hypothetical protein [Flavobacteriales bacterium]